MSCPTPRPYLPLEGGGGGADGGEGGRRWQGCGGRANGLADGEDLSTKCTEVDAPSRVPGHTIPCPIKPVHRPGAATGGQIPDPREAVRAETVASGSVKEGLVLPKEKAAVAVLVAIVSDGAQARQGPEARVHIWGVVGVHDVGGEHEEWGLCCLEWTTHARK